MGGEAEKKVRLREGYCEDYGIFQKLRPAVAAVREYLHQHEVLVNAPLEDRREWLLPLFPNEVPTVENAMLALMVIGHKHGVEITVENRTTALESMISLWGSADEEEVVAPYLVVTAVVVENNE